MAPQERLPPTCDTSIESREKTDAGKNMSITGISQQDKNKENGGYQSTGLCSDDQ